MYVVPCNYGQESLALLAWMQEKKLEDIHCLSVETGWADPAWGQWVEEIEARLKSVGIKTHRLFPKRSFEALMREQKNFPTQKFQWCASFLKGLPMLEFLDFELDPEMQSIIVLALRRSAGRALMNLTEHVESSEHYNGRSLWNPLWDKSQADVDQLLQRAPWFQGLIFPGSGRRALECQPCVNGSSSELARCRNHPEIKIKIQKLEEKLQAEFPSTAGEDKGLELFLRGCGLPFGCGL